MLNKHHFRYRYWGEICYSGCSRNMVWRYDTVTVSLL